MHPRIIEHPDPGLRTSHAIRPAASAPWQDAAMRRIGNESGVSRMTLDSGLYGPAGRAARVTLAV